MTKTTVDLLRQGWEICHQEGFDYVEVVSLGFPHVFEKYGEIGHIDVVNNLDYFKMDNLYINFKNSKNIGKLDRVIESGNFRLDLYQGTEVHSDYCADMYLIAVITPKETVKLQFSNGRELLLLSKGQIYDPNEKVLYSLKESTRLLNYISKGGEYRGKRWRRHVEW